MTAPTLDDKIRCVARELALRRNVYPGWVKKGRMKQEAADREIAVMAAVLADLEREREALSSRSEDFAAALECAHSQYENYVRQGQLGTEAFRLAALRDALSHAVGVLRLRALAEYDRPTASSDTAPPAAQENQHG